MLSGVRRNVTSFESNSSSAVVSGDNNIANNSSSSTAAAVGPSTTSSSSSASTSTTTTKTASGNPNNNRPVLTKRTSAISATSPQRSSITAIQSSTKPSSAIGSSRNTSSGTFHPLLIFAQIAALQFLHYFILTTFLQLNRWLFGTTVNLDRIFTSNYLNIWNREGWIDNGTILMSFFMGAILLAIVVEKAKKCLDFAVTLFIIHLMICVSYNGHFPISWDWWILHVFGTILMIVLGEFFCSRRELMEIPLLQ